MGDRITPQGGGIYSIRNSLNGKLYVGRTNNFALRFRGHLSNLRRGAHPNSYLQNAWNKDGENAFEFLVVEQASEGRSVLERKWADQFQAQGVPLYNLRTCGEGLESHSPETLAKLSASLKLSAKFQRHLKELHLRKRGVPRSVETRAKLSEANKGKVRSPESRAKCSAAMKGRGPSEATRKASSAANRGRFLSPEHCAKLSAAHIGKKRKPLTPEHRAKIAAAHQGVHLKPEVLAAMRTKALDKNSKLEDR